MSKRNGKLRHTNVLQPSKKDDFGLAEAVEEKYLELCALYERERGMNLMFPASLKEDVIKWRQMRVRHKSGDFRHTEAELKSVRTIAQWTMDIKTDLCNQERKILKFR